MTIINQMPPDEKENNPKKSSISTEHVFGDEIEFRLKLAKSIGYDKIPALDPTAFDIINMGNFVLVWTVQDDMCEFKIWFRYNTRESNSETRDFTICKQTA